MISSCFSSCSEFKRGSDGTNNSIPRLRFVASQLMQTYKNFVDVDFLATRSPPGPLFTQLANKFLGSAMSRVSTLARTLPLLANPNKYMVWNLR